MASSARFDKNEDPDMYELLYWNEAFLKKFWDCQLDKPFDEFFQDVLKTSSQYSMHFAHKQPVIRQLSQCYIEVAYEILARRRREFDMDKMERESRRSS